MPSDLKKKRDQKKKEALKAKGGAKKGVKPDDVVNGSGDVEKETATNGVAKNGTEEFQGMIFSVNKSLLLCSFQILYIISDELSEKLQNELLLGAEQRAVTGVRGIHPRSRDIKIDNLSITFHGTVLIEVKF